MSADTRTLSPVPSPGAAILCQLFGLTAVERLLLETLLAEGPLTLHEARGRFSLGPEELAALLPIDGLLRAHALVEVEDEAALGLLRGSDRLHPGRGLFEAWHGGLDESSVMEGQVPGVQYLAAPAADTAWAGELLSERPPAALAEIAREYLVATTPRLLWLSGCNHDALLTLGRALRARLHRPVLLLQCEALAGLGQTQVAGALRRLRRDADLRGAVVLADEAGRLQGAFRGLCAPRPHGQTAPLVLSSAGPLPAQGGLPRAQRNETPFGARSAELRMPATTAPGQVAAQDEELISATREEAKRQAAIDAARAMGRAVPASLARPAAKAVVSPAAPTAAPVPAGAVPVGAVPPVPAAAVPPAGEAVAPSSAPLASQSSPDVSKETEPRQAADAASEQVAVSEQAASPLEEAPPEQPPVPLAIDASLDELAKVARTTPNVQQRIELLTALLGKRSPAVILAFRQNIASAHPAVRTAAETGMASVFGPDWNRSRSIAPPVQPPRSDDNGRGPGGAF